MEAARAGLPIRSMIAFERSSSPNQPTRQPTRAWSWWGRTVTQHRPVVFGPGFNLVDGAVTRALDGRHLEVIERLGGGGAGDFRLAGEVSDRRGLPSSREVVRCWWPRSGATVAQPAIQSMQAIPPDRASLRDLSSSLMSILDPPPGTRLALGPSMAVAESYPGPENGQERDEVWRGTNPRRASIGSGSRSRMRATGHRQ